MPTILNVDGYRVLVYTRDHQPPHVHIWSAGCRAVVLLNHPAGPPSLRENLGFNLRQLRAIFKSSNATSTCFKKHGRSFMFSPEEIRQANRWGAKRLEQEPGVVAAKFDARLRRITLVLTTDAWFSFSPHDVQGLESATDTQLRKIEVGPHGLAIDFPLLDVQFELMDLLQGNFGTRQWMAKRLGTAGGSVRSKAKTSAARANGKRGGRPNKAAAFQPESEAATTV